MTRRYHVTVIDTETTGLTAHPSAKPVVQPRITEIALVSLDRRGRELNAFSTLLNPGIHIPEEVTEITGLTDADVEDAPAFFSQAPIIQNILSETSALVAHNMPFDGFLLAHEFRLAHLDLVWPPHLICTAQEYQHVYGYRPRLQDLYEDLTGRKYTQTHRALDDTRLLVEVVKKEVIKCVPPATRQNGVFIPPELCTAVPAEGILHPDRDAVRGDS